MSIADLCDHDTITVTPMTAATGTMMGVAYTPGTAVTKKCLVQELDGSEVLRYQARGKRVSHHLFFSSDPGIGPEDEITWEGETLQFRGAYHDSRPGEKLLWIVMADLISTRDR